ncbi:MAG: DegT/DnrJ/EryC1/StrS family aminotransferase, partial [Ignavibacteria bacterium]
HKLTGKKIYLVEDCAQSHLSEYKNKKVGTLGIASSWSFYPGKNLGAYGEAGAVITNDNELAKKIRMIRNHGSEEKYIHKMFGHNYRMEEIQGVVLSVKIRYLKKWTELRRAVAEQYRRLLDKFDFIRLPEEMSYGKHVYHLFVIKVNDRRDELRKFMLSREIETGLHYPVPLHLQPCFEYLGYRRGDFPVTEELSQKGLSLPMFSELTYEQIEYVAATIDEFYKR